MAEPEAHAANGGPELVIALVGPVGADLTRVAEQLGRDLSLVGYQSRHIRLSQSLHEFERWRNLPSSPQEALDTYIDTHQTAGNEFREVVARNDALALLAVAAIRQERECITGNPDSPAYNHAFIIRSLKHPHEERTLRKIYGNGFYLVAAYLPRDTRVSRLSQHIAESYHRPGRGDEYRDKAEHLIKRDQEEASPCGQAVSKTFPRADVFVDTRDPTILAESVTRFIEIIFQHPFRTPTIDEYVMVHALAAALRSSDLSRQVGAAIAGDDGDVIAVGTNEVPKAGGGLYWDGAQEDHRDFRLGRDANYQMKRDCVAEILTHFKRDKWLSDRLDEKSLEELTADAADLLASSLVMNITEFGRAVHAEMAALLDASKRGVAVRDLTLYTTTFPCHNCAKHIIASGIRRVVYVEPYPKSHAQSLHMDAIDIDSEGRRSDAVKFEPFVGIAPKRFHDFFEMVEREDRSGKVADWNAAPKFPRHSDVHAHLSYIARELIAMEALTEATQSAGLTMVSE